MILTMIERLQVALQYAKDVMQKMTLPQWFLIIIFIFGIAFVVKTPPLWGGDETSHYARAYQIAQGNMVSDHLVYPYGGKSYGGQVPKSVYDLIWHTNGDIEKDTKVTPHGTQRIDDARSYQEFTHKKVNNQPQVDYFFPNTAAYSPIAYVPASTGIKLSQVFNFNVGQSIFLARILGLLFYAGCVFWALSVLRSKRYAWVILTVALIPTSVFQASVISADTMSNGLAILLTVFVVKALFDKKLRKSELAAAAAAAVTLPLIKPTYIFLSLLIFLIPGLVIRKHVNFNPTILKVAVLGAGLVAFLVWTYITSGVSEEIRRMGIGPRWVYINPSDQVEFLIKHPWAIVTAFARSIVLTDNTYIGGFFGQFSFDFIQVPMTSILASFTAMLLALGISEQLKLSLKRCLTMTAILTTGVASIFGTLYITFSNVAQPIIEGVQGRYFVPYALLALTVIVVINSKLKLSAREKANYVFTGRLILVLCVLSLLLATVKFFYVMFG